MAQGIHPVSQLPIWNLTQSPCGLFWNCFILKRYVVASGSTMPFLTTFGNQIDPVTHQPRFRLIVKNGGVGPARIDWFEVRYKGVPYSSEDALLHACCLPALPKDKVSSGVIYSNVSGTMLPQRESVDFIDLRPAHAAPSRAFAVREFLLAIG